MLARHPASENNKHSPLPAPEIGVAMPLDLKCPECQWVFPIAEARHTIGIECPKCKAELTVEFRNSPNRAPRLRVTLGYPPSQTAYADLGTKRESDSAVKRRQQRKSGSILGVTVTSIAMLFISLGVLGGAGYYLFRNLNVAEDGAVGSNRGSARTVPDVTPLDPVIPTVQVRPFDLKPVTGAPPGFKVPIIPADPTIDLRPFGSKVGAIVVGGGGRYIVMHFPDKGTLQVFDVAEGRLVHKAVIEKGDVKLAAGLSCLITYPPTAGKGVFHAFTLPNLDRRYDVIVDQFGVVSAMAMGSRTNGPLLAANQSGEVALFDIGPLGIKEVDGSRSKPGIHPNFMRATPDGTAFATFDQPYNRSVKVLTEVLKEWNVTTLDAVVVIPGPDGNFYGSSLPMNRNGQTLNFATPVNPTVGKMWVVPQLTPRGNVAITKQGFLLKVVSNPPGDSTKPVLTVSVHSNGNLQTPHPNTPVLADQPEFDGMVEADGTIKPVLDQHFFLIPEAKLLVILSGDRTRLVLRKLNI